jgi:hypothetical protein
VSFSVLVFVTVSGGGTDKSVRRGMGARGERKVRIVVVAGGHDGESPFVAGGDHYSAQKRELEAGQGPLARQD